MTYFGPALDPPLGGSGRKTTTLVRDHEHFIPTKFRKHPLSGSVEKADYVFPYIYMGRRRTTDDDDDDDDDDGRTDGRRTVRYDNSSLEPSAQVS